MILALLVIPALLWDAGPQTAPALEKAGIREIATTGDAAAWSSTRIRARHVDAAALVKLDSPGVDYQLGRAGATAAPWIISNLWQMIRDRSRSCLYEVTGNAIPLAVAESQTAGVQAFLRVKQDDLETFGRAVAFARDHDAPSLRPRANFGLVDNRSDDIAEVMNLLARRNLLYEPVAKASDFSGPVVEIGKGDYTADRAADPYAFAALVRSKIGDQKRLVRVYGSETTLARLSGDNQRSRLYLIQYGRNPVSGLRVRVLGKFNRAVIASLGSKVMPAEDVVADDTGIEFSIPELRSYAVVDLDLAPAQLTSAYSAREFDLTADPAAAPWKSAAPVKMTRDALGENSPIGPTEVRSRWTRDNLYLLYSCPYRSLKLNPSPLLDRETPQLWNADVAEAFIGADEKNIGRYREYQVSPAGEWVDLDIDVVDPKPQGGMPWDSGMAVKARIDSERKIWYGEMRIPLKSIATRAFSPGDRLRLGLFRITGNERDLVAWQPGFRRSFHVPEAFGVLLLTP